MSSLQCQTEIFESFWLLSLSNMVTSLILIPRLHLEGQNHKVLTV